MSIQPLLDRVPFVAKAGIQCEDYAPGRVVLSLPLDDTNKNHVGTMHAGALFTLGETAAGAAATTHPRLQGLRLLAKQVTIVYKKPASGGVTAHAEITEEMVTSVEAGVAAAGKADVDVPVRIMNGHGEVVAEVHGTYHFRKARPGAPAL